MKLHKLICSLLDSDNWIDIAIGRAIEPINRKWYELTNLGLIAHIKYRLAMLFALLKLRQPVDKDFEFPELGWSLDFEYG